jgi:hypothetical protein
VKVADFFLVFVAALVVETNSKMWLGGFDPNRA